MDSIPKNATVVLVHGAWADGSSWREVICLLQRQGIRVIAAPIPLTSLTNDVAALRRVLERTDGPVLLAAHAYAGAVISVPNEERIKALVYIAALTPDEGETVAQVFYREKPHPVAPNLVPDAHGFIWMPEDGFLNAFAHNASPDLAAMLAAVQRPISLQCINEAAPAPSWKTKPSWFLLAEEDRMISPKTQRFMAERMRANIRSEAVDHAPLVTAPDVVVDVIMKAARATLS
ncbi:MAG: alpha/beta hydrolase [Bryobacteraceae bacterium]